MLNSYPCYIPNTSQICLIFHENTFIFTFPIPQFIPASQIPDSWMEYQARSGWWRWSYNQPYLNKISWKIGAVDKHKMPEERKKKNTRSNIQQSTQWSPLKGDRMMKNLILMDEYRILATS